MTGLKELQEEWTRLVGLLEHKSAEKFYWTELFPLVEKEFLHRVNSRGEYDWLVIPAGLEVSYYVLLIKAIKPKNVYFLGTKEFKENFLDEVISRSGLKPSQYLMDVINYDEMEVIDVYEKIRKHLPELQNKKVLLDLTRGKRIMSVGAGIVGAFFGFDLVYIDEEWIDHIKRGKPGTEKLVFVKNPFEVFGDLEIHEARDLFDRYNYWAALLFYDKIKLKIMDPREIEIERILSEAYLHWNSFNFKAAYTKMTLLSETASKYNIKLDQVINGNSRALEILSSADLTSLDKTSDEVVLRVIVDLYMNALRKAEVGVFEDSITRLYRAIELVSQYKLRKYGIKTAWADLEKYKEEYQKLTKEIYGIEKSLPLEIGLKDGYLLLYILKDSLVENESLKSLQDMFGAIRVRDTSIIAHGLQLAGEKAFKNLHAIAKKFITRLCSESSVNMELLLREHTFLKFKN